MSTSVEDAKALKSLSAEVVSVLSAFDRAKEWADLIRCLQRLSKLISRMEGRLEHAPFPERFVLAKRLAQCLNPSLPSGVHLKALGVYEQLLERCVCGSRIHLDAPFYAEGLFPLLPHASMQVRPVLLQLLEKYYVAFVSQLEGILGGLLAAILPGLEEEGSSICDTCIKLLSDIRTGCRRGALLQNLWSSAMCSTATRLFALQYLLICQSTDAEDMEFYTKNSSSVSSTLSAALRDKNLFVQRFGLDVLVKYWSSIFVHCFSQDDRVVMTLSVLRLLARREMSITRRCMNWLFPETEHSAGDVPDTNAALYRLFTSPLASLGNLPFTVVIALHEQKPDVVDSLSDDVLLAIVDAVLSLRSSTSSAGIPSPFSVSNSLTSSAVSQSSTTTHVSSHEVFHTAMKLFAILGFPRLWDVVSSFCASSISSNSKRILHCIDGVLDVLSVRDASTQELYLPLIFDSTSSWLRLVLASAGAVSRDSLSDAVQVLQKVLGVVSYTERNVLGYAKFAFDVLHALASRFSAASDDIRIFEHEWNDLFHHVCILCLSVRSRVLNILPNESAGLEQFGRSVVQLSKDAFKNGYFELYLESLQVLLDLFNRESEAKSVMLSKQTFSGTFTELTMMFVNNPLLRSTVVKVYEDLRSVDAVLAEHTLADVFSRNWNESVELALEWDSFSMKNNATFPLLLLAGCLSCPSAAVSRWFRKVLTFTFKGDRHRFLDVLLPIIIDGDALCTKQFRFDELRLAYFLSVVRQFVSLDPMNGLSSFHCSLLSDDISTLFAPVLGSAAESHRIPIPFVKTAKKHSYFSLLVSIYVAALSDSQHLSSETYTMCVESLMELIEHHRVLTEKHYLINRYLEEFDGRSLSFENDMFEEEENDVVTVIHSSDSKEVIVEEDELFAEVHRSVVRRFAERILDWMRRNPPSSDGNSRCFSSVLAFLEQMVVHLSMPHSKTLTQDPSFVPLVIEGIISSSKSIVAFSSFSSAIRTILPYLEGQLPSFLSALIPRLSMLLESLSDCDEVFAQVLVTVLDILLWCVPSSLLVNASSATSLNSSAILMPSDQKSIVRKFLMKKGLSPYVERLSRLYPSYTFSSPSLLVASQVSTSSGLSFSPSTITAPFRLFAGFVRDVFLSPVPIESATPISKDTYLNTPLEESHFVLFSLLSTVLEPLLLKKSSVAVVREFMHSLYVSYPVLSTGALNLAILRVASKLPLRDVLNYLVQFVRFPVSQYLLHLFSLVHFSCALTSAALANPQQEDVREFGRSLLQRPSVSAWEPPSAACDGIENVDLFHLLFVLSSQVSQTKSLVPPNPLVSSSSVCPGLFRAFVHINTMIGTEDLLYIVAEWLQEAVSPDAPSPLTLSFFSSSLFSNMLRDISSFLSNVPSPIFYTRFLRCVSLASLCLQAQNQQSQLLGLQHSVSGSGVTSSSRKSATRSSQLSMSHAESASSFTSSSDAILTRELLETFQKISDSAVASAVRNPRSHHQIVELADFTARLCSALCFVSASYSGSGSSPAVASSGDLNALASSPSGNSSSLSELRFRATGSYTLYTNTSYALVPWSARCPISPDVSSIIAYWRANPDEYSPTFIAFFSMLIVPRKEVFDVFEKDPMFFSRFTGYRVPEKIATCSPNVSSILDWAAYLDFLCTNERTLMSDFLGRAPTMGVVNAPGGVVPGGIPNPFSQVSPAQRVKFLLKMAFLLFSSRIDRYTSLLPVVFEKLVESLRVASGGHGSSSSLFSGLLSDKESRESPDPEAPILSRDNSTPNFDADDDVSPDVESSGAVSYDSSYDVISRAVMFCFRVVLARFSPQHVISFWPTILSEITRVFESALQASESKRALGVSEKKVLQESLLLLDTAMLLVPEDFFPFEGIFIGHAAFSADANGTPKFLPYLLRFAGKHTPTLDLDAASDGPASVLSPVIRHPCLDIRKIHASRIPELCSAVIDHSRVLRRWPFIPDRNAVDSTIASTFLDWEDEGPVVVVDSTNSNL
eukprot:ANDGO_07651.mRNA.1 Protein dopey-1 homolog